MKLSSDFHVHKGGMYELTHAQTHFMHTHNNTFFLNFKPYQSSGASLKIPQQNLSLCTINKNKQFISFLSLPVIPAYLL